MILVLMFSATVLTLPDAPKQLQLNFVGLTASKGPYIAQPGPAQPLPTRQTLVEERLQTASVL